jgi:RNA polymerase sigma-70 factor (ECF subfamily)
LDTEAAGRKLVARAQAGDQRAFGELYTQHARLIHSIIRHMVMHDDAAADLTQETFIRAWNSLPRLKEPRAFPGWLRMIALNITRDWVRAKKPTESLESDEEDGAEKQWADDGAGPVEELEITEQQAQIRDAIQRLNDDQRLVVVMHHLEGRPVAEIGRELGIPVGTVLSRLARGREALRIKLAPYVEE